MAIRKQYLLTTPVASPPSPALQPRLLLALGGAYTCSCHPHPTPVVLDWGRARVGFPLHSNSMQETDPETSERVLCWHRAHCAQPHK